MCRARRSAFSLIELLVVIAIIAVLLSLVLAGAQKARIAADKVYCVNNLKQIGIALNDFHSVKGYFPPGTDGHSPPAGSGLYPSLSWMGWILPYIEQDKLWKKSQAAYAAGNSPFYPPHPCDQVIKVYTCPGDYRVLQSQFVVQFNINQSFVLGLTSYQGVNGTNLNAKDGVLYVRSHVRQADITDGISNTLMVGERPPNTDMIFGWWYDGDGQATSAEPGGTGSCDVVLGVAEINTKGNGISADACSAGPWTYRPGSLKDDCSMFHFWSLHQNGCNWTFADGSVRFIPYSAASIVPSLATRAGNDKVNYSY